MLLDGVLVKGDAVRRNRKFRRRLLGAGLEPDDVRIVHRVRVGGLGRGEGVDGDFGLRVQLAAREVQGDALRLLGRVHDGYGHLSGLAVPVSMGGFSGFFSIARSSLLYDISPVNMDILQYKPK